MSARGHLRGGVQPPTHKDRSTRQAIETLPLPPLLTLPLGDARPQVVAGTHVGKGALLATGPGLPVHAPTSGRVLGMEECPVGAHSRGLSILLEPDGEDRWHPDIHAPNLWALTPSELLAAVHSAGIAGLGGGGFSTARKIAAGERFHTLIVNGMECEPYITADDLLMREQATAIISGINLAIRLLGQPARTLIGIEDDKPEATAAMRRAAENTEIEVVSLPTRYPSGGERQLITLLTGIPIPAGERPQQSGILCLNVATVFALERALIFGEPLTSRVVTVSGGACDRPANFWVPFGTPFTYLLAASDYRPNACAGLVLGGAMMGEPLRDPRAPVTRTTHCVLALTASELPPPQTQPCIRCGLCSEVCPVALLPQQLHRLAQTQQYGALERHYLDECIECGACNYVCPSGIPLAKQFRDAKLALAAHRAERARAGRDRTRFEAHQARVAAEIHARRHRHQTDSSPTHPTPRAGAADLAAMAMARAAAPAETQRAALERAVVATVDRLRKLEDRLEQLPASTPEPQRNALRARVEQARIDHEQAQARLAEQRQEDAAPPEPRT